MDRPDRLRVASSGKIDKLDVYVILFIFLFTFIFRMPFFDYPVIQDAGMYAKLSESIHEDFEYKLEGETHTKYPPGISFISSLVLFFSSDSSFAVRLVSIIFSSLTICLCYFFLRIINIGRAISFVLAALVFANPWFFYFTTVLGLSEGPGTFFLTLGLFFMFLYMTKRQNDAYLVLGALSLGLSTMMRIVFVVVVGVFSAYFLWQVISKRALKPALLFIVISCFPFLCWFVRNIFVQLDPLYVKPGYDGYFAYMTHSIEGYPYAILFFILIVFPFSFLGTTWHALLSFKKVFRGGNMFWKILLLSFVTTMIITITNWDVVYQTKLIQNPWDFSSFRIDPAVLVTDPFFASRYFVPFIPVITVLVGGLFYEKLKNWRNLAIIAGYSLLLLLLTFFYSSGNLQNEVGEFMQIPGTFVQKADSSIQLTSFLGDIRYYDSDLMVDLSDPVLNESFINVLDRSRMRQDVHPDGQSSGRMIKYIISDHACVRDGAGFSPLCAGGTCVFESYGAHKTSITKCG